MLFYGSIKQHVFLTFIGFVTSTQGQCIYRAGVCMENRKKTEVPEDYSSDEGKFLLKLARSTIAERLGVPLDKESREIKSPGKFFDNKFLNEKKGVFVTLHLNGSLRGCIGSLEPHETIVQGVINNSINAAFHDPRFSPLSMDEFKEIDIEVSILSRPEKLEYSDGKDLVSKLEPGVDGVIISKGRAGATFLPQVWDQLPDAESFLSQLCRKAGLPGDEWEKGDLDVKIYHVQYFNEKPLYRI